MSTLSILLFTRNPLNKSSIVRLVIVILSFLYTSYSIYWNKVCYVLIWKLFLVIINLWIISGKVSWGYQKWNVNSCLTSRQNKCAFLNLFKCHKNLRLKFVNLKASRKLQMFLHSQSNHALLNFKNILPFDVQKQAFI